ncbi:hypothetical protein P106B_68 [Rhizobium phage vB_RglS_P106B]|uniref:Uncharacterized protein n=1 Tax=Rhizobium phage vB_RglS_P106B TaxID=1458697 RepID=W6EKI8_9CAUD|nr:hypothetical protein P106B_68 [Rhizobium phage vB_RglS_P106B]AHJ10751.1 hypothetical protein P106B_68 [Rhizobium phage vB_RglS_P106B]
MRLPWNSRKLRELEAQLAATRAAAEEMAKHAFIVSIERRERLNVFTFIRNGETYQIETMGLISDDITDWKRKLL